MDRTVSAAINHALDGTPLSNGEMAALFSAEDLSEEAFAIQRAGRLLSSQLTDGKVEIHGQIGINTGLCPVDCKFCSLSKSANVFTEPTRLSAQEVVDGVLSMEQVGANAIYLMETADYPFDDFLEMGRTVRKALKTDIPLIANAGDFGRTQADELVDAGFAGVYHAIRMGEGRDTSIPVRRRIETIEHAQEAGLKVGMCVEPVGPEHTVEELVEKTAYTRDLGAVFSGAMRRTAVPGSELEHFGQVSFQRMATIVAAVALATGTAVSGNCTHEPNQLAVYTGANLLWAEVGSNPRDTEAETSEGRGWTVGRCRGLCGECGWDVLEGPSRMFA